LVYDFLRIKRFYEDWRKNVERDSSTMDREDKSLVLNALSSLRGGLILDVGCGYGRHLKFLRNYGFSIIGVDLAKNLLKRAKTYGEVVVADIQHLPFRDKAFDASISMWGPLNHIPQIQKGLSELKRATRKRIIATVFNFFSWYGVWIDIRFLMPAYLLVRRLLVKLRCNAVYYYVRYLDIGAKEIWRFSTTFTPKSLIKQFHSVGLKKTTWKPICKYFRNFDIFSFLIGIVSDI